MTRDMTQGQFEAALKRNGFSAVGGGFLGGLYYEHPDAPNVLYGAVIRRNGSIHRRRTLARLIQKHKRDMAAA